MQNYDYFGWSFKQEVNIEGGKNNDPNDLGNKDGNFTYMGLSSYWNPEIKTIINLPKEERLRKIREIYYVKYWQKVATPIMSLVSKLRDREQNAMLKHLTFIMFDAAVQYAPKDANKLLQKAINRIVENESKYLDYRGIKILEVDGIIGNKTILALLKWLKYGIIDSYLYLRGIKYMHLIGAKHSQAENANGWANRLEKIDNLIKGDR